MWWTRKSGKDLFERPLVEQLEPRLLYSADLAAALGLPATGSPAPQERTLDDDGEFTQEAAQASSVAATTSAQATQSAVPLAFEVNAGQADASLDLLARGSGYAVGLSGGNATLVLGSGDAARVLQMQLLNANAGVGASAEGLLAGRTNYFIGSDPANWHTDIANYSSVTYRGVYDGIDLRYYGNSRQLEYDFIVKAGSDVQAIALRFDGAQALSIDADGNLVLTLDVESGSAIRFLAPVAYQEGAGGREAVASRYVLGADGSVHFEVADYDHARTLVIDPVLAYGTYLGGTSAEAANAIATDAAGNVYLAGYGNSTVLGLGGENVMVSKFSADLTTNLYTTYYGGLANERATALAVDASGNVYVTGWTKSGGLGAFPTSGGAYQTSLSGAQDAFVLKLDASGGTIVYSSYLGGSGNGDIGNGIAIDATGNAYVAGTTNSSNFPTTVGAADRTFAGNEAFVTKFNAAGTALVYSSFVGGSGNEEGYAIAVDGTGRAVIVGMTASNNFSLVGASQTGNAGTQDAFVARLNSAGSAFDFSTYYGGTKEETAYAVALRADGTIVIGGVSKSNDLPITSGAVQNSRSGGGDSGFVAIVNPSTATLAYATYLGGRGGNEAVTGMALDAAGRVYAVGYSGANSFTTSANALDASYSGATDAFVTLIDPTLSGNAGLLYSSYLGGTGADRARGAAFSGGTLFVTGETASSSGIATSGGADTTYAGGTDAFVVGFTGLDGQNTAPVLSGANNLATILEDAASNAGTLVSALLTGRFSDADVGGLQGIAVTGVDNSNGTWQYSTNGGSSWTAFGTPGGAAARLLAADGNTYVRFVPNANWNGSVAGGLTFRAWDQTSGTAGGTADTTANGGATAFSTATADSSVTVTAVNDAPSGSSQTVTTLEDAPYTFGAADFGFADTLDAPANALANVRITNLPAAGTLTNNGIAVLAGQFVSIADIAAGKLVFTPVANTNGSAYAVIGFQVQDDGGTANGGIDLDPLTRQLTIDVTEVSNAPVGADKTVTTFEGTAYIFALADFTFTDTDDAPANNLFNVRIAALPGAGALTLNGTAVTAGQYVSAADIAAGKLAYAPAADANGAAYATFGFQVQDDGGTANGGEDLDTVVRTMTVDVTPVNDAPQGGDQTIAVFEDTPYTFGLGDFGFTDAVDSPANGLLNVRITSVPTTGTLTLNGTVVAAGQFISAADIAANRLVFAAAPNASGLAAATFAFQVQDDGGVLNGGIDLEAGPHTITLDVAAVNDAPTGADHTVAAQEDAAYTFGVADFGFGDALDGPANNLLNVRIATLPSAGALTLNGAAVTAGQSISAADIAAGKLVFNPAADSNGSAYAGFTFQVQDDGGTANGGADLDTSPRTMTVDVAAVNDAPAGQDNTVTTLEDTAYVFNIADFGFADPADTPANELMGVKFSLLPAAGTLTLNGVALTAGQTVSAADIVAGKLAFTPDANANGSAYGMFRFQLQDDGGSALGGVDLDPVSKAMTIDVSPVNDPPVSVDRTFPPLPGGTHVFTVADFAFADPGDVAAPDAFDGVRIATLPASGGLLLYGAPVAAGQYISAADIAAGGLRYIASPGGTGSFAFAVQDAGSTANGGSNTEAGTHLMSFGDPQAAPLPPPPLPADPTPVVPVATSPPVLTTPATTAPAAAAAATVPAGGDGVIIPGSGTRELNAELARSAEQLQLSTARREAEAEVRVAGISVLEHRGDTPATQADLLDLIMQNLGTSASASPALFEQLANSMRDQGFISELDRMREEARGEFSLDNIFAVSAGGVTFGLSVVVVIWIIRSGVLLGSLLSAMPAWRVLDPLPVLSRSSDGKAEEEDDEDYQSFDAGEADADPERVLRES